MKRFFLATVTLLAVWIGAVCFLTPTTANAKSIKVGAILAETGGASFLGGPESRTIRMQVDKINAAGGINGDTIELIIKDSGGSPEKAISFAKQLIEEEQVLAILGPSTSGETMGIKKICEDGRTILLSCSAAEVIVNPVAKYVFKTPQKDSYAAKKIFMEMNKMGISKIAVLAGNTGFGKAGKEQLETLAPEFGIEILGSEVYDKSATDLSAVIAKLKANKNIQAVVNWSIVPAQAIVAKNIRNGMCLSSRATVSGISNMLKPQEQQPKALFFRQAACWWLIPYRQIIPRNRSLFSTEMNMKLNSTNRPARSAAMDMMLS